jgi:DNA polymerase type B, organellar and viral
MNAKGSERFIAKMHLNQLYGYFGRSLDLLNTLIIPSKDLNYYLVTRVVKKIIEINEDILVLVVSNNLNTDLIKKLNITLETEINSNFKNVKSNVAIASAVTAYARIHMLPYKMDPDTYYSDTDSIFTSKKLDQLFVGKDLGLMKDEMADSYWGKINEAYFLGNKQYGFHFVNSKGITETKSVFAGVKRNTLN